MREYLTAQNQQLNARPTFTPIASGLLQRRSACGQHISASGECRSCRKKREGTLQRAAISPSSAHDLPPIVHEVLRSPGQPLDATTRAFMEPHFGHDFSGVRVHTDVKAAESARAVNALAYTVGSDVVFGNGQYVPQSNEGRRLMAHELTHVVQQGGILAGAYVGNITPADHASEREAQHMARMIQTDTQQQIAHQHSRPALACAEDGEAVNRASNGCRKVTEAPCPGARGQFTRIEYFPSMFLVNRGTCPLFVGGLGPDDKAIDSSSNIKILPGESATFVPPDGSVAVGFGCEIGCDGIAKLEHPYLCA